MIKFTVPGVPVAKQRSRSFSKGGFKGHYTPDKTVNYENLVKWYASSVMKSRKPMDCAVQTLIELYLPIPKSFSRKKRDMALNDMLWPTVKPDCSNLMKSIEDGMNNIVYLDDKQIVKTTVLKKYSDSPCAVVTVAEYGV